MQDSQTRQCCQLKMSMKHLRKCNKASIKKQNVVQDLAEKRAYLEEVLRTSYISGLIENLREYGEDIVKSLMILKSCSAYRHHSKLFK